MLKALAVVACFAPCSGLPARTEEFGLLQKSARDGMAVTIAPSARCSHCDEGFSCIDEGECIAPPSNQPPVKDGQPQTGGQVADGKPHAGAPQGSDGQPQTGGQVTGGKPHAGAPQGSDGQPQTGGQVTHGSDDHSDDPACTTNGDCPEGTCNTESHTCQVAVACTVNNCGGRCTNDGQCTYLGATCTGDDNCGGRLTCSDQQQCEEVTHDNDGAGNDGAGDGGDAGFGGGGGGGGQNAGGECTVDTDCRRGLWCSQEHRCVIHGGCNCGDEMTASIASGNCPGGDDCECFNHCFP